MPVESSAARRPRRVGFVGVRVSDLVIAVATAVALLTSLTIFAIATEDVAEHNGLALHDAAALKFVMRERSGVLVDAAKWVSYASGVGAMAAIAVIATVWFWRRGVRFGLAVTPIVAFGIAGALVGALKTIVARQRPPVPWHLVTESNASFPSGHATDSAAVAITTAVVLAAFVFRRPIIRALALLVACCMIAIVGASRLLLGVHWPTDVLAGWALGISVALAVTMSAALLGALPSPPDREAGGRLRRTSWRALELLKLERNAEPRGADDRTSEAVRHYRATVTA